MKKNLKKTGLQDSQVQANPYGLKKMQTFHTAFWMLCLFVKVVELGPCWWKVVPTHLLIPVLGPPWVHFFSLFFFPSSFLSSFPSLSLCLTFLPFFISSFTQACLKITMYVAKNNLDLWSACLQHPNARIADVYLSSLWGTRDLNPQLWACYAGSLSSKCGFIGLIVTVEPMLLSV